MNILHMKYAVEVARAGSINKAAERLYIAQPNLSRCIKELEADLGILIFERTFKGMSLTPEGESFIGYAEDVLEQIDSIENMYKGRVPIKQRFSISVPRASYIADAFVRFTRKLNADPAEIYYMETNSATAINNILEMDYRLGIIRYAVDYDRYFKAMLDDRGLTYEVVSEFRYVLIMSAQSTLSGMEKITAGDLRSQIEIAHADPYVPSLPDEKVRKEELSDDIRRRIFLYDRAGQFELLIENPETFMWVSKVPQKLLDRCGLVERECEDNIRTYKDVLIHRKDYELSDLDKQFLTELSLSKRQYLQ